MPLNSRIALALALGSCSEYSLDGLPGANTACEFAVAPAANTPILEVCEGTDSLEVNDPWNVVVEWELELGAAVYVTPAVANLTDDNADGKVDDGDIPDIVVVTEDTSLIALQGDGSAVHFDLDGYAPYAGIAVGDVEGDGRNEIVALNISGQVALIDGDGQVVWTSDVYRDLPWVHYPALGDIDGDGLAEVIFERLVLNGSTGELIVRLDDEVGSDNAVPHVADLDRDGTSEILVGGSVSDASGATLWASPASWWQMLEAVVDVDGDPDGEVVISAATSVFVHDTDGTLLWTDDVGSYTYAPCIADLDGDGTADIVVPAGDGLFAYKVDGTRMWHAYALDLSGSAGCSAFDFDLDGAYEVLFADEDTFRIHDGRTGEPRFEDNSHNSVTFFEYPVIADLDRDGSAEIVVVGSNAPVGIRVYGHADGAWPRSGPTWGMYGHAYSSQRPDGSFPADPSPSWAQPGLFRARPPIDGPGLPALKLEVTNHCVESCKRGSLKVAWQASNPGFVELPAGATVSLLDADGAVLASTTLGPIAAGQVLEGMLFELDDAPGGKLTLIGDAGPIVQACEEPAPIPIKTGCP